MTKIYRSAKGVPVNMEELRAANEDRVASGNMQVNARGDRLGKGGEVVQKVADLARNAQARMKKTTVKASVKAPVEEEITKLEEPEEVTTEEHIDEDGNITVQKTSSKKKKTKKKES
jgi:hypothetical protein